MASAFQIKEHMAVLASDGEKIGTVDHMEGEDKIKLTKHDAPDGQHHFVPLSFVDHVDRQIHLNKTAATIRGQW